MPKKTFPFQIPVNYDYGLADVIVNEVRITIYRGPYKQPPYKQRKSKMGNFEGAPINNPICFWKFGKKVKTL